MSTRVEAYRFQPHEQAQADAQEQAFMSDIATAGESQRYFTSGIESLDKLMIDEHEAKFAALAVLAARGNLALSGLPGGAKSLLTDNLYRLFADMSEEHVAEIPSIADLTPKEIIGGEVRTRKIVDGKEEVTITEIDPIITPETRLITIDEFSRLPQLIRNALLSVAEERKMRTTAGTVYLPNLQAVVINMNPSEKGQGTFPISYADTSRMSGGQQLGGTEEKRETVVTGIVRGFQPRPEEMVPVTDLQRLARIRRRAQDIVQVSPDDEVQIISTILEANEALRRHSITDEEPNREAVQIMGLARIIATVDRDDMLSMDDVNRATKLILAARVGMLGLNEADSLDALHTEVMERATARANSKTPDLKLSRS